MPLDANVLPRVLLDLAGLQCSDRNVQAQTFRQDAPLAHENGTQLHARALFDGADATATPDEECSPT
jgi:hypothetical protein